MCLAGSDRGFSCFVLAEELSVAVEILHGFLSHSVWHSSVKNGAEEPPNKMQLVSVNAGVGIQEDGTSIQVERGGILGDIVVSRAGM